MKKMIKNKRILIVFLCFFLLVLFQHHFMWLYHDDYGYASLSYVGDVYSKSFVGYHTSLANIFKFLIYHYNNWGGRVLYFFVECILLRFGMHVFRVAQSVIILAIFYYLYKIVSHLLKKDDWKLALFIVSLYGVFEIMLFRNAIFWITASVLYLFPILPFLMFIYYYVLLKKNYKFIHIFVACFLVFISSFSQEQISAMVVSFTFLYFLFDCLKNKKFNYKNFLVFVFSVIGFAILFLSPGSKQRLLFTPDFYNLSIFAKVKQNLPNIIFSIFGGYTRIFTLLFFTSVVYISYKNMMKSKKIFRIIDTISLLSCSIVLGFSIFKHDCYFNWIYSYTNVPIIKLFIMFLIVVQLLLTIYSVVVFFINDGKFVISELFLSSIASQLVMIVAPYFPLRSAMIMQFIIFIIIAYIFYKFIDDNKTSFVMVPVIVILIFNYLEITYGYYRNNNVNYQNHIKMIDVSNKIKSGEKVKKIILQKLPNILYSCDQPYTEGFEYITFYMKVYYNIPLDVEVIYE